MNILLTGGVGYIGSHTAVVLAETGHEVVLYDNFSNSSTDVIHRLTTIIGSDLPFVQGDVRDTARLTHALRTHHIEAVVHFAGLKAVGESVIQPIAYYDNNVNGAISLLQAMQTAGARTLVFSSSATVYGDPQYLPFDEAHPTSAINPYGRTKLHIEQMLCDVARTADHWRIACLRYFNPVGAHESGLIGENPKGIPNNLMPYVARVASGQLPHLEVFGADYSTADGTGVRDYIHVVDLAKGHLAALDFLRKEIGWHVFNLGTGRGYSVLEIVRAFELASNRPIPYRVAPRRMGDLAAYYAEPNRAKTVLNWQAERTLQEMCASMWRWQERLSRTAVD